MKNFKFDEKRQKVTQILWYKSFLVGACNKYPFPSLVGASLRIGVNLLILLGTGKYQPQPAASNVDFCNRRIFQSFGKY